MPVRSLVVHSCVWPRRRQLARSSQRASQVVEVMKEVEKVVKETVIVQEQGKPADTGRWCASSCRPGRWARSPSIPPRASSMRRTRRQRADPDEL